MSESRVSLRPCPGRRLSERSLRLARVAVESSPEGVAFTDPELGIHAMNRAFREITGCGALEDGGRYPSLFELGRHGQAFYDAIWASLLDHGRWKGEIQVGRSDGATIPLQLSIRAVRDDLGRVEHYVAVLSDISALSRSEARFDFLSHHDALTGLPNRLLFNARGEHALARARRRKSRVAVMCLDLDLNRCEHLDDTLGHPAGDALLRRVAERVSSCVRAGDTVARARGDELTVLLEDLPDAGTAGRVARKILGSLERPFSIAGYEFVVATCVGASVFPEDGDDLASLMRQAATAMHRAREHAHGRLQFYTAELTRAAVERSHLESALRRAVRSNELALHYQPQVSIRTGEVVGLEALVRWFHPELGLILPAQFLPLAEESGLAAGIGEWVMRSACRQASRWMAEGLPPLRTAVNLTAEEIAMPALAEQIAGVLDETGLEPGLLEIEITEGSVMVDLDAAVGSLEAIKALGVTIALDDFGTGYSSLNHVRHFPIDRLKLDCSFVSQIAHDEAAQAIARAAIALGHGLRVELVAEGVESPEQLDFLRASDCDTYQGHLFAAALPPDEIAPLLLAQAS